MELLTSDWFFHALRCMPMSGCLGDWGTSLNSAGGLGGLIGALIYVCQCMCLSCFCSCWHEYTYYIASYSCLWYTHVIYSISEIKVHTQAFRIKRKRWYCTSCKIMKYSGLVQKLPSTMLRELNGIGHRTSPKNNWWSPRSGCDMQQLEVANLPRANNDKIR